MPMPAEVLRLLTLEHPIRESIERAGAINFTLTQGSWTFEPDHLRTALEQAQKGIISLSELEEWAIEVSRLTASILVYPPGHEQVMRSIIFSLSEEMSSLTREGIADLIVQLNQVK